MKLKFEEAKKLNDKIILKNKLQKILNKIVEEFNNTAFKQTVNAEIIDKVNDLNLKLDGKWRINKKSLIIEKLIILNNEIIEKTLIDNYWNWIQNKNINKQSYEKMFKEIENFMNISENIDSLFFLFEEIEIIENKKYSGCFLDLFTILNNYKKFNKTNNFDKNWYLRIIFKELFSLIDKFIFEKCLHNSLEQVNFSLEDIKNNHSLKYLLYNFLPEKIDKWKVIFLEKYNKETKEITLKSKKNLILKKLNMMKHE